MAKDIHSILQNLRQVVCIHVAAQYAIQSQYNLNISNTAVCIEVGVWSSSPE